MPTTPKLCRSARMIAASLRDAPNPAYLLNADGIVLYVNLAGQTLVFETTDQHFDKQAAFHQYHFSFFWKFSSPNKPWRDFWDDIIQESTNRTAAFYSSPRQRRRRRQHKHNTDNDSDNSDDDEDAALSPEEYDVTVKRTNGTEFPGNLRLIKVGECPCCDTDESVYLVAYVQAAQRLHSQQQQHHHQQQQQQQRHSPLPVNNSNRNSNNNPFENKDHHLKCILNASFDPVFIIDEDGCILLVNQAALALFGWTEEEFLGNDVSMICGGNHGPKHREYIRNYIDTGEQKMIGKKREVPARKKDGTEFPVELGVDEISCADFPSGKVIFCAFVKDLSSRKKHEFEVKHRMNLMQGMINASFDPMFQIRQNGEIETVNDAAVALFGYSRSEMIGHNISIICGGGHGPKHQEYINRYIKDGHKRVVGRKRQVTAKRKDGTEFEIELGVQEVVSDTGEKLFCGFVRDLTQQLLEKRKMREHEAVLKGNFFGKDDSGGRRPRSRDMDHSATM